MTAGDLVFWVSNLAIVFGYMTVAGYFATVESESGGVGRHQKWAGMAFFFLCASTHAELAVHALTDVPILQPNVAWHFVVIHVPQAVSIWAMIYFVRKCGLVLPPRERREIEPNPCEGGRRSYDP